MLMGLYAQIGTPLCVPSQDMISIGRIASMEVNHKVVDVAKKGQAVAMKVRKSMESSILFVYLLFFLDHVAFFSYNASME